MIPSKQASTRVGIVWTPPQVGTLKFNVDGSSIGKPGPIGIGGVWTNHLGCHFIRFSKNIGHAKSNMAEVLAIREALILFLASI